MHIIQHLIVNKWVVLISLAVLGFGVLWIMQSLSERRSEKFELRAKAQKKMGLGGIGVFVGLVTLANAAGLVRLPTNAPAGDLPYVSPPGWTDLSPGTPLREKDEIPDALRSLLKHDHRVLAVDWRPGEPAAAPAKLLATSHIGGPVSMEFMQEIWREKLGATAGVSLQEGPEILHADKRPYGRLLAHVNTLGGTTAMLVFFVDTGENTHALLSFSTKTRLLAKYRPLFEETARATVLKQRPRDDP